MAQVETRELARSVGTARCAGTKAPEETIEGWQSVLPTWTTRACSQDQLLLIPLKNSEEVEKYPQ
ncbi:hypothetical protein P7K49_026053 [Saguinus oedipus]|uniref:Uncharacterized protein n=1 Tax=Saguinus oedipus TaxID=9490 RepID=A0ABQ9UIY8_SAGOE|nr:hypothetical protein P7K49_026053 [Saguinus oedipus]